MQQQNAMESFILSLEQNKKNWRNFNTTSEHRQEISLTCSDIIRRATSDVIMIDDERCFGVDKYGNVFGVHYDALVSRMKVFCS